MNKLVLEEPDHTDLYCRRPIKGGLHPFNEDAGEQASAAQCHGQLYCTVCSFPLVAEESKLICYAEEFSHRG